jgi:hypothetical protein
VTSSPADRSPEVAPLWLRIGGFFTSRSAILRRINDRWIALGVRRKLAKPYHRYLEDAAGNGESLLEAGCGDDSPFGHFKHNFRRSIGVDLFEPAIERSRAAGIHDEYVVGDVRELAALFEPNSVDVVAAFDVIEHLTEPEGRRLLDDMERIARKRVVVFTPNGFLHQGEYAGNPWQVHSSGWPARKMRRLGYRVRGVHGLRWLRGEYSNLRFQRPLALWNLVSDLTQPVTYRVPDLAFQIVCVKELDPKAPANAPERDTPLVSAGG